ncbi:MAG: rhodanese-like domain-containing protein [Bacteroidota bacterium]
MNTIFLIVLAILILAFLFLRNVNNRNLPSISHDELEQFQQQHPQLQFLDVRTPNEAASGRMSNAKLINFMAPDFSKKIAALPKDKTYVVYCRSGRRSAGAVAKMLQQGFTEVYNLRGGYQS